jgi:hypothetical protein
VVFKGGLISTDLVMRTSTGLIKAFFTVTIYRVSQEQTSICREVIVSVILSKNVYLYMLLISNRFRDRAILLYRQATYHVLTRVAKCIDVDGGIFENVLH